MEDNGGGNRSFKKDKDLSFTICERSTPSLGQASIVEPLSAYDLKDRALTTRFCLNLHLCLKV